ncbi:hypothetical protein FGB62_168g04 [Gracilaria domingensis]|nr:hypothetical protein FGB62_168g04 [Gracilaria domingensis]
MCYVTRMFVEKKVRASSGSQSGFIHLNEELLRRILQFKGLLYAETRLTNESRANVWFYVDYCGVLPKFFSDVFGAAVVRTLIVSQFLNKPIICHR